MTQAPKSIDDLPCPGCGSRRIQVLNEKQRACCLDCGLHFTRYESGMLYIDAVLEALNDNNWHSLNELSVHPFLKDLSITKLMLTLNFLEEYNFIELEENPVLNPELPTTMAKLAPGLQGFLTKIRKMEKSERNAKTRRSFV